MPAVVAISAALGLERLGHWHHRHVHGPQHVGQHMVGLDLEVVGLQLNRHMAVAQVVGGADQVERRAVFAASGDAQYVLRCSLHANERAVFGHQHIAAAHHGAAQQKHTQCSACAVGGIKAAFLAGIPIQRNGVGAFNQHTGQATALRHEFGANDHQNKK